MHEQLAKVADMFREGHEGKTWMIQGEIKDVFCLDVARQEILDYLFEEGSLARPTAADENFHLPALKIGGHLPQVFITIYADGEFLPLPPGI